MSQPNASTEAISPQPYQSSPNRARARVDQSVALGAIAVRSVAL